LAAASRIVSALDAGPAGVIPPAQPANAASRRRWYRFAFTPARMSIAATILVAAGLTVTARRAAENSSVRGRLIDSQIRPAVQAMSAPAMADSVSTKRIDRAESKLKATAKAPAPITTKKTEASSAKANESPTAALSNAAGVEQKTLPTDKQPAANSPRQTAAGAPAPVAEPAPPAARAEAARADAARAKDEVAKVVAADSLRRGPEPERRQAPVVAGNANQMQGFVLTERDGARSSSVLVLRDCYQLAVDSTAWRGVLPSGFALDAQSSDLSRARMTTFATGATSGGGGRGSAGATPGATQPTSTSLPAASPAPVVNSVRALDSSGRVGAVIGLWFLAHTDTIGVRLSKADANQAVTLLLTAGGSKARVISGGRTDSVRVARTSCPR
jgi:large subunit ribosomal protein L10